MIPLIEEKEFKKDKTLGYMYAYKPKHPLANKAGKVYQHRYIISVKLGRNLETFEHVHHKNENRSDNREDNLELLLGTEHAKHHHPRTVGLDVRCSVCGKLLSLTYSRLTSSVTGKFSCSIACNTVKTKKIKLSESELIEMYKTLPATKIASFAGVSDVTVGKWLRRYGIETGIKIRN